MNNSVESYIEEINLEVEESKTIEERRKMGQFFTPFEMAKEMTEYALSFFKNDDKLYFLEPAFGTGVFYCELLKSGRIVDAIGYELDSFVFSKVSNIFKKCDLSVINDDFLSYRVPDKKYNLVLTNPPYVRHHFIDSERKQLLKRMVYDELGIKVSGLSGLYVYFVLLTHSHLSKNAISGWLVPSEFMDVNYGKALKEYLLTKVKLLRIHRYDPNECQFDDALVSSCVVWFENKVDESDYDVIFTFGGTQQEPFLSKKVKKSILLSENKWTRFPGKEERNKRNMHTLGDFFTIKRGVATGDNSFFIMNKEKVDKLKLEQECLIPILPSPRYLKTDVINSDPSGLPALDKQLFLLKCDDNPSIVKTKYPNVKKYLDSGIKTTANNYLCKSRKQWYFQEKRESSFFLCTYMGREDRSTNKPFKFILNKSKAIVSNSYLILYPKSSLKDLISNSEEKARIVWNYLNSIDSSDITEEGRVYGGGLKKIEPKELSKTPCVNICELLENSVVSK